MDPHRKNIIHTLNRCREWCVECRVFDRAFLMALLVGLLGAAFYLLFLSPPRSLQTPTVIRLEKGMSLQSVANRLEEDKIIRYPLLFSFFVVTVSGEKGAVAGSYFFAHPQNVMTVAFRVAKGDYELAPVKVTFPEGVTTGEMALILKKKLGTFDTETFLSLVEGKEGYLFPDTYHFLPDELPETVVSVLEETFFTKRAELQGDITASGKTLSDIVTMASLLEEEARTTRSRQIISGILWKRIERGMRLQVDAVFPYILGKNTFELTLDDLAVDSPYNTYRYAGLPLGPISNPGLDSLRAALHPVQTPYLYYLSDKNGVFHWSRTYEEHLKKKKLYLGT